jgi:hypothetical protein
MRRRWDVCGCGGGWGGDHDGGRGESQGRPAEGRLLLPGGCGSGGPHPVGGRLYLGLGNPAVGHVPAVRGVRSGSRHHSPLADQAQVAIDSFSLFHMRRGTPNLFLVYRSIPHVCCACKPVEVVCHEIREAVEVGGGGGRRYKLPGRLRQGDVNHGSTIAVRKLSCRLPRIPMSG